jgi:hypothetical protein
MDTARTELTDIEKSELMKQLMDAFSVTPSQNGIVNPSKSTMPVKPVARNLFDEFDDDEFVDLPPTPLAMPSPDQPYSALNNLRIEDEEDEKSEDEESEDEKSEDEYSEDEEPKTRKTLVTPSVKKSPTSSRKKRCETGKTRSPVSGRCVQKCPPGTVRSPDYKRCLKKKCDVGKIKSPMSGRCVQKCPPGSEKSPDYKRCLKKCKPGQKRRDKSPRRCMYKK